MTFIDALNLRPTTRSREIRLPNVVLDTFVDPRTEIAVDVRRPLPLAQILTNLDALHADCNGVHVCGLPRRLRRIDLIDILALQREYREAVAA
jgi:hypothetical protein